MSATRVLSIEKSDAATIIYKNAKAKTVGQILVRVTTMAAETRP